MELRWSQGFYEQCRCWNVGIFPLLDSSDSEEWQGTWGRERQAGCAWEAPRQTQTRGVVEMLRVLDCLSAMAFVSVSWYHDVEKVSVRTPIIYIIIFGQYSRPSHINARVCAYTDPFLNSKPSLTHKKPFGIHDQRTTPSLIALESASRYILCSSHMTHYRYTKPLCVSAKRVPSAWEAVTKCRYLTSCGREWAVRKNRHKGCPLPNKFKFNWPQLKHALMSKNKTHATVASEASSTGIQSRVLMQAEE